MRYTAKSLTRAERPVVFAIGRPGASWLSRWWHRRFRTWVAKPISTPQMLALQGASAEPLAVLLETAKVLRAVLPRRWYHVVTGDPVAMTLRLPEALRARVLAALLSLPADDVKDDSPLEQMRRQQRAQVYGDGERGGLRPTLALAALTVRQAYGEGWYYNPARWGTSDGYAPFAVCWLEYVGLQALEARQRLIVADGTALASAKDGPRVRRQLLRLAYPGEAH